MSRCTQVPLTVHLAFAYGAITLFGRPSQVVRLAACFPSPSLPGQTNGPTTQYVQRRQACIRTVWASPRSLATTSGISVLISFPEGTEMFQFPSFATLGLCIQPGVTSTLLDVGFPIRRSTGQRLYTAHRRFSQFYHVLLRLLVPRHPPNALTSLTTGNVAPRHKVAASSRSWASLRVAPADSQAIYNRRIRLVCSG